MVAPLHTTVRRHDGGPCYRASLCQLIRQSSAYPSLSCAMHIVSCGRRGAERWRSARNLTLGPRVPCLSLDGRGHNSTFRYLSLDRPLSCSWYGYKRILSPKVAQVVAVGFRCHNIPYNGPAICDAVLDRPMQDVCLAL